MNSPSSKKRKDDDAFGLAVPAAKPDSAPELAPERISDTPSSLSNARLKLPETLADEERRRSHRAPLGVPVTLDVFGEGGKRVASGTAMLRDLSLEGAYIENIAIEDASLHDGQMVELAFTVRQGELAGMTARCAPVRVSRSFAGIGVELVDGFHFWV